MTRKNTSPKLLAAEYAAITQFLFDRTTPDSQAKLPMFDMFEAYQDWRQVNKMRPTKLTIDGFGRLFPKVFERGSAYHPELKHAVKFVYGLGLK